MESRVTKNNDLGSFRFQLYCGPETNGREQWQSVGKRGFTRTCLYLYWDHSQVMSSLLVYVADSCLDTKPRNQVLSVVNCFT